MTEERRIVTVLFADVVESTALGENLDAEEVRSFSAGTLRLPTRCCPPMAAPSKRSSETPSSGYSAFRAARLQQGAGAWQIIAAERTVRSAAEAFDLGPRQQLEVKGKTAPVAAYEVRGRRERREQGRRQLRFRGRSDELEELRIFDLENLEIHGVAVDQN